MRIFLAIAAVILATVSATAQQCFQACAPQPNSSSVSAWGGANALISQNIGNPWTWPDYTTGQSLNYVYSVPTGPVIGKTLTMTFNLDGNAPGAPNDPPGGYPTVNLFLWRNGDNGTDPNARWWCQFTLPLVYGDNQMLGCLIDPSIWTNVNGQHDSAGFSAAISNPFAMGITFGGTNPSSGQANFGHGVKATGPGTATFTVTGWSVQ